MRFEDLKKELHVRVEYDTNYRGGDYSGDSEFTYVSIACIEKNGWDTESAFKDHTGLDPVHIVQFSEDELYYIDGRLYQGDEYPGDQSLELWRDESKVQALLDNSKATATELRQTLKEIGWSEEDLSQCDDCGKVCLGLKTSDIRHYSRRVEPGEMAPSGECPECEALTFPVELLTHSRNVQGKISPNDHPDYPLQDWQVAVGMGKTRMSYQAWVVAKVRDREPDLDSQGDGDLDTWRSELGRLEVDLAGDILASVCQDHGLSALKAALVQASGQRLDTSSAMVLKSLADSIEELGHDDGPSMG